VAAWLRGEHLARVAFPPPPPGDAPEPVQHSYPGLAALGVSPVVRQVLEVSAAGGHHLWLTGPREADVPALAAGLVVTLLPDLTGQEAAEVTAIYSAAGLLGPGRARIRRPPLRVPDHRATIAAVTGGGTGLTHIPAGSPARTPTPCPRHGSPKPATAWATGCPGRRGGATATSRAMSWPAPIPPLTTAKPSSTTPSTSG
jgi:magnesium chelatase family protein